MVLIASLERSKIHNMLKYGAWWKDYDQWYESRSIKFTIGIHECTNRLAIYWNENFVSRGWAGVCIGSDVSMILVEIDNLLMFTSADTWFSPWSCNTRRCSTKRNLCTFTLYRWTEECQWSRSSECMRRRWADTINNNENNFNTIMSLFVYHLPNHPQATQQQLRKFPFLSRDKGVIYYTIRKKKVVAVLVCCV